MNLLLLERVFTNNENRYSLDEAKEIGKLFFHSSMGCPTKDIQTFLGDYWIQIGYEWDLNVWFNDVEGCYTASLYSCPDGIVDDTQNPIPIDF